MTELREPTRTVDVARAVTLVDAVQGLIKGWHFIWGSPNGENGVERDSYGTWFDKARPPNYSAKGSLVGYPICVEHGLDPVIDGDAVAVITRNYFDDVGLAFEAQLDRSHPAYERTLSKIQRGDYKTSSSSAEHMAKFYDDGAFRNWMHTETSLVENPSQAEMPAVSLVRSTGISGAEDGRDARRASSSGITNQERNTMLNQLLPAAPPAVPATRTVEEELAALVAVYGVEAVKAALDAMQGEPGEMPGEPPGEMPMLASEAGRSAFLGKLRAHLEAQKKESEIVTLRARLDAIETAHKDKDNAPPAPEPRAVRGATLSVSEPRKFWGRSTNDLLFAHQLINSREFRANGVRQSEEFLNVLAGRALTDVEKGASQFADPAVRSVFPKATRANEVAISTASGGGDEWVGIAYSTSLWEKARDNRIYEQLVAKGMRVEEIEQGFESIYIPTEGADPTVYTIAQNADLDATSRPTVNVATTRIGTGRALLAPGELGMAVAWSDPFDEDSLIRVAPQYNRQMEEKAAETVEQLFINADSVTGTTNINYDDGTPGTGLSTPYYIASNGAIKYALVTGSSTSRDGGALDENDYRLTVKLMPSAIRTRLANLAFIIDPDTHSASLDIAAVKTDDVRRTNATITSGVLTNVYGVDVLTSGFMLLAAADGKVTYNAAGTLGRILCVYAPYWCVGTKRQITVETDRDILSGTNIIVAKMRIGFIYRGAGASTISYNITV